MTTLPDEQNVRRNHDSHRSSFFNLSRYGYFVAPAGSAGVPRPVAFKDLSSKLQTKFKTAGVRRGEQARLVSEAEALYLQIPRSARLDQESITSFLSGKDASHVKAHGGNSVSRSDGFNELNSANNLIWEGQRTNRQRGSRDMTETEMHACIRSNQAVGIKFALKGCLRVGLAGAIFGAALEVPLCVLEQLEKSLEVSVSKVAKDSAKAGAISGLSCAAAYACLSLLPDSIVESEALQLTFHSLAAIGWTSWSIAFIAKLSSVIKKGRQRPDGKERKKVLLMLVI